MYSGTSMLLLLLLWPADVALRSPRASSDKSVVRRRSLLGLVASSTSTLMAPRCSVVVTRNGRDGFSRRDAVGTHASRAGRSLSVRGQ
uniref:Putative secreted protein n=1 Tax=Ixodes ricinus TaxID=34613 RepID=A0A6B0U5R6_IXORI